MENILNSAVLLPADHGMTDINLFNPKHPEWYGLNLDLEHTM